jgi:uncharacterized protein involved in exopolysaccharide biosynthesis
MISHPSVGDWFLLVAIFVVFAAALYHLINRP